MFYKISPLKLPKRGIEGQNEVLHHGIGKMLQKCVVLCHKKHIGERE